MFTGVVMNKNLYIALIFTLLFAASVFGQRPPGGGIGQPGRGMPGRDQGRPPRDGGPPMGDHDRERRDGPPDGEWIRPHDANGNDILESEEFKAAIERTFGDLDRNRNGTIEGPELEFPPRPRDGQRPGKDAKKLLPPFFFESQLREGRDLTRIEFDRIVTAVFNEMDENRDGSLGKIEARKMPRRDGPRKPEMAPNARFIAAELRFGDKLVKGQPFSAEILIEDTRRLFDGSTVTKQVRGATFRDGEGRTRREQPLEMVGGINVVGSDNKPQMLVFINDFVNNAQIFLDVNNKVARKSALTSGLAPEPGQPRDAKTESLGTKMIEGVSVEGTRVTFDIPVGQIGNDKPIQVVSERWYSPELQVLVMSKHLDPIAGEHVFKLVNIKRSEPSNDLFGVPAGYSVENVPAKRRQE